MPMKNILLLFSVFFTYLFIPVGSVCAQQTVLVGNSHSALLSLPLSRLERVSFSDDLETMCVELSDGADHQISVSEPLRISFLPSSVLAAEETTSATVATLQVTVASNRRIEVRSVSPILSLALYDATGRRVLSIKNTGQSADCSIDASRLPAGVYILSVEIEGQRFARKIVIK